MRRRCFDSRRRSFIVIPAGVPHFVAAKDGAVIVQLSGTGKFGTDYLEK
jgi:quercetin dioxygenase-like cupin family protein